MVNSKKTSKKSTKTQKKDFRSLDMNELKTELLLARKELFTLTMKHSLRELKQPHRIREVRRNIARIFTAINASI